MWPAPDLSASRADLRGTLYTDPWLWAGIEIHASALDHKYEPAVYDSKSSQI